jgi:hypothetical protein
VIAARLRFLEGARREIFYPGDAYKTQEAIVAIEANMAESRSLQHLNRRRSY